jgi:hypothetical protein
MATSRPFSYNTGALIPGTTQSGNIATGFPTNGFASTGLNWRNGPNEDLGYVVAFEKPLNNQPTPDGKSASVRFWRSSSQTDNSFISLVQSISKTQSFANASDAKTWLNTNGYWTSYAPTITMTGLRLYLDASNSSSYSGTGTTWYDLSGNSNDVTMQNSGSITYNSGIGYFSTGSNGWFSKTSGNNMPTGNSPYTLSVWVQLGSSWSVNGLISIGPFGTINQSNAFRTDTTNSYYNYWWANDLYGTSSLSPATVWFNAVAKFDGTTRSIWINGNQISSDTPVGHNVTTSDIQVGKTVGSEYLNGNIAQALIYDVAISDAQVLSNFNSTKARFGY